jgi:hypothetical protein
MSETDLPEDIESCHTLIRRLRDELQETRRKLSVHVENERRQYEARYGKGATHSEHWLGDGDDVLWTTRDRCIPVSRECRSAAVAAGIR